MVGRVVLPARLSGSALRVNRGSYNGCGGAADQSDDQGRQDEELPHGNPPIVHWSFNANDGVVI